MSIVTDFSLYFHEQWLGISTLTSLEGDALITAIHEMELSINNLLSNVTDKKFNKRFVPDENIRKKMAAIAQTLKFKLSWNDYIEDINYEKVKVIYEKLGYILVHVEMDPNNSSTIQNKDIRPEHLQQIILLVWFDLIKKYEGKFLFDEETVPYAISICTSHSSENPIRWNQENFPKYKKELGTWVSIYSGQFDDYLDSLYENRIKGNLSNKTSEIHLINRNSGLLYMDRENYDSFFIKDEKTPNSTGYVYNTIIKTVFQMRCIGFAMVLINHEIDVDTQQLTTKEFKEKEPSLIKKDLDKTNRLKMILQKTLAPVFTDLSRSHRQHYHALLKHCVEKNDIEKNWEMISEKLESNTKELNSIFLDVQEKANKRQESILSIVNILLGAGIVFELLQYIIPDADTLQTVMKIVGGSFLVLIIFFIGGLYLPSFIKKIKKRFKKKL